MPTPTHHAITASPFAGGLPPLALYLHLPWCVQKCGYCDFNSYAQPDVLPEGAYIDALLRDLELELARLGGVRPLVSIYIGGGTPSLFSAAAMTRLLDGIAALLPLSPTTEISLEANPGTADAGRFAGYAAAGINRLSIGVQSLSRVQLQRLGRIHDPAQARATVAMARQAGFAHLNLDLMFGLPGQGLAAAGADLAAVLEMAPEQVSYYQLTIEPNTAFQRDPPSLPDPDLVDEMQQQGLAMLGAAGYTRYEISSCARPGHRCVHNLNYWTFGDYLGLGAGAHGKLTDAASGRVQRRTKLRSPRRYLAARDPTSGVRVLDAGDLVLEFALNALRLPAGFTLDLFPARTGLAPAAIADIVARAIDDGLMEQWPTARGQLRLRPSALGLRFLNDLIARFDTSP